MEQFQQPWMKLITPLGHCNVERGGRYLQFKWVAIIVMGKSLRKFCEYKSEKRPTFDGDSRKLYSMSIINSQAATPVYGSIEVTI
ncbi:hypothetical protein QQP08_003747 [Theobroma cacao]|nr:hypothetical protein QQP08_003747 [Theobroma cacao]